MDYINLLDIWKIRGKLMKSVPKFLLGVHRLAMRQAFGSRPLLVSPGGDVSDADQSFEVVLLSPLGCFIFRPSRGGQVPKKALLTRVDLFNSGQWSELVEMEVTSAVDVANVQARDVEGETQRGHCGEDGSQSIPHGPIG